MSKPQALPKRFFGLIIAMALAGVLFLFMEEDAISSSYQEPSSAGSSERPRILTEETSPTFPSTEDYHGVVDVDSTSWITCPANKILPNIETASVNAPSTRKFGNVPLLFIANTKCGSSSLSERFKETLGEQSDLYLTRPLPDGTNVLLDEWETSVVLSIIRNPFTRFCSIYDYCQKDEHRKGSIEDYPSFLETSKDPTILEQHCVRANTHWMPYLNKFLDGDGVSVYYDCMLRLEHLDEDWEDFCWYANETTGYDVGELLGHVNSSEKRRLLKRDPCPDYYEAHPESVAYVHEFYRDDIEHFGYSYPYEYDHE